MSIRLKIPQPDNAQHVENLSSIPLLKEQGFKGPDASLVESLFEYGLAWRDLGDEYLFIYKHPILSGRFDRCTIPKDYDVQKEYDWVEFKHIADYCGEGSVKEWLERPVLQKIQDIIGYHGVVEIFGGSYWEGFKISEE